MVRRLHTPHLFVGDIQLDATQARHARDVLRLADGTPVEVFDDAGSVASGTLILRSEGEVFVRVQEIATSENTDAIKLTVAAAVPKGERADWMVEKLSELGVAEFVPLQTARSVVKPEGKNKYDRWNRIATESAKQSRRIGVMRIGELTPVSSLLRQSAGLVLYFSTDPNARPLRDLIRDITAGKLTLHVGPEGGWTPEEVDEFRSAGVAPAKLTSTILRVETAAVAGAAVVMVMSESEV